MNLEEQKKIQQILTDVIIQNKTVIEGREAISAILNKAMSEKYKELWNIINEQGQCLTELAFEAIQDEKKIKKYESIITSIKNKLKNTIEKHPTKLHIDVAIRGTAKGVFNELERLENR